MTSKRIVGCFNMYSRNLLCLNINLDISKHSLQRGDNTAMIYTNSELILIEPWQIKGHQI